MSVQDVQETKHFFEVSALAERIEEIPQIFLGTRFHSEVLYVAEDWTKTEGLTSVYISAYSGLGNETDLVSNYRPIVEPYVTLRMFPELEINLGNMKPYF